jgi:hypothetical protein
LVDMTDVVASPQATLDETESQYATNFLIVRE